MSKCKCKCGCIQFITKEEIDNRRKAALSYDFGVYEVSLLQRVKQWFIKVFTNGTI